MPALITAFSATICCSPLKWWRGLDSNQRRRKPTDLQSAPFNHSGTPPRQTDNYRYRSFHCQGFVSVPFKNEKQHAVILSVAPLILQWPFHDRPSFYFGPRLSGRKCAASAALGTRSARKSGIGRGSRATRIQTLENSLPPVFSAYSGLMAWYLIAFSNDKALARGAHAALIVLDGEIAADQQTNAERLNAALKAAFSNRDAVGIILKINSPGGSPVQAGMVNDEIRRLRAKYPKKPVYAAAEDLCASGAYYIAVAADKIFVDKASLIGSIGVRSDNFGFTGLMDKLGIERRLLMAGRNKALNDPFLPLDAAHAQYLQTMLDQIHAQFIEAVRQGRGDRLKEPPEIFSGLIWTGQQSVALGLADGFGDAYYVAREILKTEEIIDYSIQENLFDRVSRKIGLTARAALAHVLEPTERFSLN